MKKIITSFFRELISRKTWDKVWYFSRAKDPSELSRILSKGDILPIILSILVAFGSVYALAYFFSVILK